MEKNEQQEIILVVEDNPDLREVLQTELEDEYEMLMAGDGRQGLDLALLHVPDLVITDIMMPVISGIELCRQLKENEVTCHVPVIMLTARDKESEQVEGLEVGANDYITKPFSTTLLKMRVHNLLETRRNYRVRLQRQLDGGEAVDALPMEDRLVNRAAELVRRHMGESGFGVQELAHAMNLHRRTLQRKLKVLTDQSPGEFIRSIRMTEARRMLEAGEGTVSEIAFRVGYAEPTHFSRSFRRQFGFAPSQL